ncbi:MAG: hypothetical protein WAK16_01325 [Candidatus Cybelea sp.]
MRISDLGARTLGVLGAITLLAGCGGGSMGSTSGGFNAIPPHVSLPNPVVPPSPSRLGSPALDRAVAANEVLSAHGNQVRVLEYQDAQRGAVVDGANFSAAGNASGVYRGTFTASGTWSYTDLESWNFNETFTITTAHRKIAGTVRGGGYCITLPCSFEVPRELSYTVNGAAGKATAKIRKGHFKATLYGLVAVGVQQ